MLIYTKFENSTCKHIPTRNAHNNNEHRHGPSQQSIKKTSPNFTICPTFPD